MAVSVQIVKQPKQNLHFRSEKEKRTHTNYIHSADGKNFPEIHVTLSEKCEQSARNRKLYVLVSLHCYEEDRAKGISQHALERGGSSQPANHEFIFEEMLISSENPSERFWILERYTIIRVNNDPLKAALFQKCSHYQRLGLPLTFKELNGDVDLIEQNRVQRSNGNIVCLGFTIFERNQQTNEYTLLNNTIYSDEIYNGDTLKAELCNRSGSVSGGETIYICGNFNRSYNYTVCFTNADKCFEKRVSDIKRVHNCLKFVLPEGPLLEFGEEVVVNVTVAVRNSTYKMSDLKFIYFKNESSRRARMENPSAEAHLPQAQQPSVDFQRDQPSGNNIQLSESDHQFLQNTFYDFEATAGPVVFTNYGQLDDFGNPDYQGQSQVQDVPPPATYPENASNQQ